MMLAQDHFWLTSKHPRTPNRLGTMNKTQLRIALILAVPYVLALLLIAFWPTPVDRPASGTITQAIRWLHAHGMPRYIGYNKIEFAANIALFMPFGYIASIWGRKWWHPMLAGFATSFLIELGQEILLPERVSSLLDVVANAMGAALGSLCFWLVRILHERRTARSDPEEHRMGVTELLQHQTNSTPEDPALR